MRLYLFIIALALLAGCKKSDINPQKATAAQVVGKWYLTVDTIREYENGSLYNSSATNYNHTNYLQFNSDGSGMRVYFDDSGNVTNNIAFNKYTVSNGTILEQNTNPMYLNEATIKSLSTNKMVLYFGSPTVNSGTGGYEAAYFEK